MKRSYEIYQPSKLIRDFYVPSSDYYQTKDVRLSPFTKVGSLVDTPDPAPRINTERQRDAKRYAMAPVFTKEFGISGYVDTYRSRTRATSEESFMQPFLLTFKRMSKKVVIIFGTSMHFASKTTGAIAATVMSLPGRIAPLWMTAFFSSPHVPVFQSKYVIGKGVQKSLPKKTYDVAKVSFVGGGLIILLLFILGLRTFDPPAAPTPATNSNRSHSAQTTVSHRSASGQNNPTTQTSSTPSPVTGNSGIAPGITNVIMPSPTPASRTSAASMNAMSVSPSTAPTTPGALQIPGVTTPYSITAPNQTIQVGGKQVIGTSPTTVTLN